MANYPIFPVSPSPADLSRGMKWGGTKSRYDSGAAQGLTPYQRPLYQYQMNFTNIQPAKRDLIVTLINSVKGTNFPFWFADPYDYVNSALFAASGAVSGASLQVFDTNSFLIRPASSQVSTLFSSLSGYVTNGTEFSYNMDSGWITVATKATADVWGVRSLTTLFKKCWLDKDYSDASRLWNTWGATLEFSENI